MHMMTHKERAAELKGEMEAYDRATRMLNRLAKKASDVADAFYFSNGRDGMGEEDRIILRYLQRRAVMLQEQAAYFKRLHNDLKTDYRLIDEIGSDQDAIYGFIEMRTDEGKPDIETM